ncbi:MAG: DUF3828 domain-containing protein [Alphaproteobacteria bacterium]|nr:DUF3828 domain-containing protein [Alphaproteobacteria bacterium]
MTPPHDDVSAGAKLETISRLIPSIAASLSLLLLACPLTPGVQAGEHLSSSVASANFHPATTPAENTLHSIILMAEQEDGLFEFAIKAPWRDRKLDRRFSRFFSSSLQDSWAETEKKEVQKNCEGVYRNGEICGLDINPVTCSQDINNGQYEYKTEKAMSDFALISYKWPQFPEILATYKMIREGNRWRLDGVSCNPQPTFNMK